MKFKPNPDFERYMIALNCEEPDRIPLGDWHVDALPKENYMGKKIITLEDQIEFWLTAGFDYITSSSGILEPVRAPEGMTIKGDAVNTAYGIALRGNGHVNTMASLRTGKRLTHINGHRRMTLIYLNGMPSTTCSLQG